MSGRSSAETLTQAVALFETVGMPVRNLAPARVASTLATSATSWSISSTTASPCPRPPRRPYPSALIC